jgi:toxin ParE1/3/4
LDYTAGNWPVNHANKYYNLKIASCLDLKNNSLPAKPYKILLMNVLEYKCSQHIIFCRKILKLKIEIGKILHETMSLKGKIKETRTIL